LLGTFIWKLSLINFLLTIFNQVEIHHV
jgi:hypothetical protein